MNWYFPEGFFNITDKGGIWTHCQLVTEDGDSITFNYVGGSTGAMMRGQIKKDDILSITYLVPISDIAKQLINSTIQGG